MRNPALLKENEDLRTQIKDLERLRGVLQAVYSNLQVDEILQQILTAFGQVSNSFQYLVNSWTTIVELLSIYKRLASFELAIRDEPLPEIDQFAT